MSEPLKVKFEEDKETAGTWRFKECDIGPLDTPMLKTVYIPKSTLKLMGWEPNKGRKIIVGIELR